MERSYKRRLAVVTATAAMALTLVAPAAAVDTVDTTVTGGSRTASIADLTLPGLNYSHSDQTTGGTMQLSVNDETGTGDGWNVTVLAGDFAYTGDNAGSAIPAANFNLDSIADPVLVSGQAIDPTGGPLADSANVGTLDSARKVIHADAGYGSGSYTQDLPVTLTVPGETLAGAYTSTLTVTNAAGPGI